MARAGPTVSRVAGAMHQFCDPHSTQDQQAQRPEQEDRQRQPQTKAVGVADLHESERGDALRYLLELDMPKQVTAAGGNDGATGTQWPIGAAP